MVLPGTYTPVRAINQTNPLRFSPFGPFTQQMIIHFYSDFTVMFQHFQLGEIDISDWPLQSSADISTFCSNADFFCTSPQPQLGYFGQELNSHTPFMGIALTQARTTSPPSYTTTSTAAGCSSGFGSLTVTVRNQETSSIVLDSLNALTVANQPSGSPSATVSDSGGSTPNGVYNIPCILAGTYSLRSSVYNATGTTVAIGSATTTSGTLNANWNSPSNVRPTRNRALLGAAIAHLLDDPEFVSSTFGPVASAPCAFMVLAQGQVCPTGTTSSYQCLLPPLATPAPCPALNPLGGAATQNDNAECQFGNHLWLNVIGCASGATGHDLGPYNVGDDRVNVNARFWNTGAFGVVQGYSGHDDLRAACDDLVSMGLTLSPSHRACRGWSHQILHQVQLWKTTVRPGHRRHFELPLWNPSEQSCSDRFCRHRLLWSVSSVHSKVLHLYPGAELRLCGHPGLRGQPRLLAAIHGGAGLRPDSRPVLPEQKQHSNWHHLCRRGCVQAE